MEEHGRQHILSLNIEASPAKAGEERYETDELHLRETSFYIYISFSPAGGFLLHHWPGPGQGF